MLIGDFNEILLLSEVKGGKEVISPLVDLGNLLRCLIFVTLWILVL